MATWMSEAVKHTTSPATVVEIALDSGTRKYSVDYIRPIGSPAYKGNVLKLPYISNSIGDLVRTFISSRIEIIFADTDREFRNIIVDEGIKNREVTVKLLFIDEATSITALTIFVGNIYNWNPMKDMKFKIECEQKSKNLKNTYPDKVVEATDYANADEFGLGRLIPVPYGTISADGLSDDGAFPCILVDPRNNDEIHLVGRQAGVPAGNITVDRVFIDGTEKTGAGTHYTINHRDMGDGFTHTEIIWEDGVNPTFENVVTCDITFGARNPCEAWKHFLIEFCDHVAGDFDATSYDAAHAIEINRGYTLDGAFIEEKELITHEDHIRDEFELDIWRDPKDGLIHFKYISSLIEPTVHYKDYIDILKGYEPNTRVEKIINYLRYGYNYNYARTYFFNLPYREDTDSQAKYGATYRDQQNFYFVRSTTIALDLAARKLLRRKDPITFDKFPLPIKAFNDNLGDVIEITHFEGKGSAGYVKRAFQIRTTQDDLDDFTRKETLEDVTNYVGSAFILGPADLAKYPDSIPTATPEQQEKYGFLCGDTAPNVDKYSNGDPAKRLYD